MNATSHSIRTIKRVSCSALSLALAGCTTYVEETPVRTVYEAPPPVYAPPPPAQPPPPPPVYATSPPPDAAVVTIRTESDFDEPLSPYGEWVVVGSYGRCWRPLRVAAGWRPYCNGYWQRTDAGWFWVTDEPWGWATYHYGRWDWTVNFGWIWVPQTQWAPSWVAWREGAGYIGWAPLPPTATIAVSGGVVFRDAAYAPRAFVFVEERRLLEPVRPATVIVNNTTVINKTLNITKIQVVNKTVINEGPHPEVIERVTGRRIQTAAVRDLRHREEAVVVDRRHNPPRNVPSTIARPAPPPARTEPQPAKAVLPHAAPLVETTVRTKTESQPAVTRDELHGAGALTRPRVPAGTAVEKPARKEPINTGAVPVAARPAPRSQLRPAVPPREPRQIEKPLRSPKEKSAVNEAGTGARPKHVKKEVEPSHTPEKPGASNPPQ